MKAPVAVLNEVRVPLPGPVTTESGLALLGVVPMSVSLASTLPVMAVSSLPVNASFTGSGAKFMLMVA